LEGETHAVTWTRTPREMAIAWAIEERKALEKGYTDE
jgi:hypothetical protein